MAVTTLSQLKNRIYRRKYMRDYMRKRRVETANAKKVGKE